MSLKEKVFVIKAMSNSTERKQQKKMKYAIGLFRRRGLTENTWQLLNSIVPFLAIMFLMVASLKLKLPYVVSLFGALFASLFLIRIFIIFHDCVHGSYFKSKIINTMVGSFLGVLTFTPFEVWRFNHLTHHGSVGNLDNRGLGDVWTLTVKEYNKSSKMTKIRYRLYRNPFILLFIGSFFIPFIGNRFSKQKLPKALKKRLRINLFITNFSIIATLIVFSMFFGWKTYLFVFVPVIWMSWMAGIWLFYVQHQFPGVYWERRKKRDSFIAATQGSSFFKLPTILRWFTGSIGYHHIHHLNPRIPNYNLKKCYDSISELQKEFPLTLLKSINCFKLKLWDEDLHQLVSFPKKRTAQI